MVEKTKAPIAKGQIDVLAEAVASLSAQVDALTKQLETAPPRVPAPKPPVDVKSDVPIPTDYRNLVDTILNTRFGIEIKSAWDAPAFDLSILVPQDYSNAGKPHWETYKEDRRSRVILSALGLNGVREWVQKVYDNFDTETKTRITMDRTAL